MVQFIPGMNSFSFGAWRPVVQSADSPAVKEVTGVPAAVTPDTIWKTYQVMYAFQYMYAYYHILLFWLSDQQ